MNSDERRARHVDVPTTRVFVGRQREIGILHAALAEAIAGSGCCVMLAGEPGIGKTRLCQEIAAYAGAQGALALYGRGLEQSVSVPYWPWVQALRTHACANLVAGLHAEIPLETARLAALTPDLRSRLPGLDLEAAFKQHTYDITHASVDNQDQGRLWMCDAIATFLQRASQQQPIVVILDNLHWADPSSLLLLEFMAEELTTARLLLMGTYRDTELSPGHLLHRVLGELIKWPHFQRLSLTGLSVVDVAQFIALVCGVSPPLALVRELHHRTAGNPLFITEVVRLLHHQGVLRQDGMTVPVELPSVLPAGVRDAIRGRLDRLSQDCNRALTLAAVIGRQFGLNVLEQLVADLSSEQLLTALEEALTAGIVEEAP